MSKETTTSITSLGNEDRFNKIYEYLDAIYELDENGAYLRSSDKPKYVWGNDIVEELHRIFSGDRDWLVNILNNWAEGYNNGKYLKDITGYRGESGYTGSVPIKILYDGHQTVLRTLLEDEERIHASVYFGSGFVIGIKDSDGEIRIFETQKGYKETSYK